MSSIEEISAHLETHGAALHGFVPSLLSCAHCREQLSLAATYRTKIWRFMGSGGYQNYWDRPSIEEVAAFLEAHKDCDERAEKARQRVGMR